MSEEYGDLAGAQGLSVGLWGFVEGFGVFRFWSLGLGPSYWRFWRLRFRAWGLGFRAGGSGWGASQSDLGYAVVFFFDVFLNPILS